jgi:hypothetical protein
MRPLHSEMHKSKGWSGLFGMPCMRSKRQASTAKRPGFAGHWNAIEDSGVCVRSGQNEISVAEKTIRSSQDNEISVD